MEKGQTYHHGNPYSSHPETLPAHPNHMQWHDEDFYKTDKYEYVIPTDKYHSPAVIEGGLLSAQVPRHTLIGVDRFLKILKTLAGFAILIAISMPFIQVVTSFMLEAMISYI